MQNNQSLLNGRLKAGAAAGSARKQKRKSERLEQAVRGIFFTLGMISTACVLLITIFLTVAGIPAIQQIGLVPFLTGTAWTPTAPDPQYGVLPFILSSVYGMAGALLIGLPIGVLTALWLSRVAPAPVRNTMKTIVDLLAGIPSVIYGLVGMIVLVPAIRTVFGLSDGACLLAAVIVLAIMILPSIISLSMNAIDAVPREMEEASLALGADPVETMMKVTLPAASSGIAASAVLGAGRAIGEATAVIMVSGNAANMPGVFQSVRFLTTAITSEMSYASGLQLQALFSIALVLFLMIMMINAILNALMKKRSA